MAFDGVQVPCTNQKGRIERVFGFDQARFTRSKSRGIVERRFLRLMGFHFRPQIKKARSNGSSVSIGQDSPIRRVKESIRDVL